MKRVLVVLLAFAGLASAASAQTPLIVTDRPDQTESAATVPVGALQLEAGGLSERSAVPGGRQDSQSWGAILARYGLHPRLEARLGFAGWQRTVVSTVSTGGATDGIGDLEAGVKLGLLSTTGGVALAILASTTVPAGTDAYSSGRLDPRTRLALAVPLTSRLSFGVNAGVFWSSSGPAPAPVVTRSDALYTAVLGFGVTDRVSAFAESFGSLPVSSGGASEHLLDGGITVLLSPTLQLDASGGIGIHADAPDWFVGAGVSVRLGR